MALGGCPIKLIDWHEGARASLPDLILWLAPLQSSSIVLSRLELICYAVNSAVYIDVCSWILASCADNGSRVRWIALAYLLTGGSCAANLRGQWWLILLPEAEISSSSTTSGRRLHSCRAPWGATREILFVLLAACIYRNHLVIFFILFVATGVWYHFFKLCIG